MELLGFFNRPTNLTSLVINGTSLIGAFPRLCDDAPVLSNLVSLHIYGTDLYGWLPVCIWDIESVIIIGTKIEGQVENAKDGAKIRNFHFEAVRSVLRPVTF